MKTHCHIRCVPPNPELRRDGGSNPYLPSAGAARAETIPHYYLGLVACRSIRDNKCGTERHLGVRSECFAYCARVLRKPIRYYCAHVDFYTAGPFNYARVVAKICTKSRRGEVALE